MGVKRTELTFEGQFTQIPNAWLRDERLTRKARGVLAEIMSHRVGWHVSVNGLVKVGPEGRDAIKSALVELKDAGYLRVSQTRGERGRWNEVEYELSEPPTADGFSVTGGLSVSGSSASGQSAPKNTISTEDHREESLSPDESDDLGTLIPDDWRPNLKHVDKAASLHLDVKREYLRFRSHAERNHRRQKNWNAAFTNWLQKGAVIAQQQGGRPSMQTFAQQKQTNMLSIVESYRQKEQGNEEVRSGAAPRLQALDGGH